MDLAMREWKKCALSSDKIYVRGIFCCEHSIFHFILNDLVHRLQSNIFIPLSCIRTLRLLEYSRREPAQKINKHAGTVVAGFCR